MRRTAGLLLALALTVAIAAAAIRDDPSTGPDPSLAAVTTPILTPDGPPTLQPLAEAGALQLDVPIRQERITAVVYHGIGDANTIPLQPIGRQLNAGFFSRLGERVFGGHRWIATERVVPSIYRTGVQAGLHPGILPESTGTLSSS